MTQRSVTYLKGRWETGDIPTQSDYQDLMDSFLNLEASAAQSLSGKLEAPAVSAAVVSAAAIYPGKIVHSRALVSASLGTQAGAAGVSADINVLYGNAALGFGVVLVTAEPGRVQHLINTATTVMTVFPASGCNFIGTAENAPLALAVNSSMMITHITVCAYAVTRGTM